MAYMQKAFTCLQNRINFAFMNECNITRNNIPLYTINGYFDKSLKIKKQVNQQIKFETLYNFTTRVCLNICWAM